MNSSYHLVIGFLVLSGFVFLAVVIYRAVKRRQYCRAIGELAREMANHISRHFFVQPCTRCYENLMSLEEISPNAKSILCKCDNCNKSYWAPAADKEALIVQEWAGKLNNLKVRYSNVSREGISITARILFTTPEATLPYQQTTREPIPESVRAEVWRRDQGRCVSCGTKQHLEFDHIIPVSRGGATSPKNLQLLCKTCNLKKGQRI